MEKRQLAFAESIPSTSVSLSHSQKEYVHVQYRSIRYLHAELFIARWHLYNLQRVNNPAKANTQALASLCETDRWQALVDSIVNFLSQHQSSVAMAATSLSKLSSMSSLFDCLCISNDSSSASRALDLILKFTRFSPSQWVTFVVSLLKAHYSSNNSSTGYLADLFERIQRIVKVCSTCNLYIILLTCHH